MDEGNLLYVAVTRAKHAVQMSSTVKTILQLCGVSLKYFHHLIHFGFLSCIINLLKTIKDFFFF